jgi:hypothetical protein
MMFNTGSALCCLVCQHFCRESCVIHVLTLLYLALRLVHCWHVVHMGEMRGAYRVLVGRPEERRPLGRPWHRSEDNITIDL